MFSLSLKHKDRNLSSLPHSLELISAYSPPQRILPTWYKISLHVWSFGELEENKPTFFLLLAFSSS